VIITVPRILPVFPAAHAITLNVTGLPGIDGLNGIGAPGTDGSTDSTNAANATGGNSGNGGTGDGPLWSFANFAQSNAPVVFGESGLPPGYEYAP
jgi:hypothetical protein